MQQSSKKPKCKNLRNVLQNPFTVKWSAKTMDEAVPLHQLLKEVLPSAKLEKTEQRIKFNKRKEVSRNISSKKGSPNYNRTHLAIGFNHVIRSLEIGDLCCILVASDIEPPLLTKTLLAHVLGSRQWTGASGSVPVVVLPELRTIARSALGHAAMTIGLKNAATNPDNIFNPVYKFVSRNPTILESTLLTSAHQEGKQQPSDEVQPTKYEQELKPTKVLDFIPENVYLYRKSTNDRVFIPENLYKMKSNIPASVIRDDFVSFGDKITGSKGSSDFLSFGDNPTVSVALTECKKDSVDSHNMVEDDNEGDDDDDDDVGTDEETADNFFIDYKRDDSLIKTFEKNVYNFSDNNSKKDNLHRKPLKLQPGISRMFQAGPTKTKDLAKFKSKKMKKKLKNKVPVNYQPLKLKTITGNAKRVHRKSK